MDQVNKGKNGVTAYGGQVEFNKSAIYGNKCIPLVVMDNKGQNYSQCYRNMMDISIHSLLNHACNLYTCTFRYYNQGILF